MKKELMQQRDNFFHRNSFLAAYAPVAEIGALGKPWTALPLLQYPTSHKRSPGHQTQSNLIQIDSEQSKQPNSDRFRAI